MPENYFKYLQISEVEAKMGDVYYGFGYSKIESNQNYPISKPPSNTLFNME